MASAWSEPFDESLVVDEFYGQPISADEALRQFGEARAPVTQAAIVYRTEPENSRDRRFLPRVSSADFFSSLVVKDGRYFFSGFLNGWGGLSLLELASIEQNTGSPSKKGKVFWSAIGREVKLTKKQRKKSSRNLLNRSKSKETNINAVQSLRETPKFPRGETDVLVKLFKPLWTEDGYHPTVPGHLWYYTGAAANSANRRVAYGTNCFEAARQHDAELHGRDSRAVRAYHFGHRYAKEHESRKDRVTYHTAVFVEWDHGEYGSIFELAWLHGIGGYSGRSNFVGDTEEGVTELFRRMPAELKQPFKVRKSEVRCIDVKQKNVKEFRAFLEQHTGKKKRFLDPKVKYSGDVRLVNSTKAFILNACCNRIRNNSKYSEPSISNTFGWNCQTFAASFFGFLTNATPKTFTLGVSLTSRLKLFSTDPATGVEQKRLYEGSKKKKRNSKKHN